MTIALIISITVIRVCHALLVQLPVLSIPTLKSTVVGGDKPFDLSRYVNSASMLATGTSNVTPDSNGTESDSSVLTGSKLSYFGIPGRGEAIRLTLAISGVQFEDNRVPFPAWGKMKPTTPWGTLPILELSDGTQLAQTRSILRFVGKHTGLYPAGDERLAQRIDEMMDVLEDLGDTITKTGKDLPKEEMKVARLAAVSNGGAVYNLLSKIDTFIEANSEGSGYAVGTEMNIASILTFTHMGRLVGGVYIGIPPTVCDPFPNIQKVRKTVGCYPAVIEWYNARLEGQPSLSPAERVLVDCRNM